MSPGTYFQFAAALAFVVALIAVLAWAVKRSGLFAHVIPARGGKRRLAVVDVAAIDAKRRLVLVRRDDKEHLLLLGANNDAVIETGITPPQPDAAAETAP